MIPIIYGYARVSKSDCYGRNLEKQLYELDQYSVPRELIFVDDQTGTTFKRPGWVELREHVKSGDTNVVVWRDRFSRNFDDGVAIQADLTKREIRLVSIKENIDTSDDSAGAKYFRRLMLAQGAYQANRTSERVRAGLGRRARAEGKRLKRPPTLTQEQVQEAQRIYADNPSTRRTARVMCVSQGTVKKALGLDSRP